MTERVVKFYEGDEFQQVQPNEIWQPHKDGTMIPTEVVTTLIPDENGTVIEVLGVSRDIRERKEAELKIQKAITQINNNLETLAILNYQIRNHLTIIDMLCEDFDNEYTLKFHHDVLKIDELIKQVDSGFVHSENVRKYHTMQYSIDIMQELK